MAIEKQVNARLQQKHDIEANWLKSVYIDGLEENGLKDKPFIPKAGEIIIYDPDESCAYPRFKFGDGSTIVNLLPVYGDYLINLIEDLDQRFRKYVEVDTITAGTPIVSDVTGEVLKVFDADGIECILLAAGV